MKPEGRFEKWFLASAFALLAGAASAQIQLVPTFIVDGKFLTSARLAGGTRQVVQVVDQLVRLAREERVR
jgi:hypothetical protein